MNDFCKRGLTVRVKATLSLAAALAFPAQACATAFFYANLYQSTQDPQWNFKVDTSVPSGPAACLDQGQDYAVYINQASTPIEVVSIGPPFSGSANRTRYLSACYDSTHYVIVEMSISLTDCVAWVCTTDRSYGPIKASGGSYSYKWGFFESIGISNDLKITLPDYP